METESAVISQPLEDKVKADSRHEVPSRYSPILQMRFGMELGRSRTRWSSDGILALTAVSDGIYLNDWAAKDLGAKIGDPVTLEYYYWEPSGSLLTLGTIRSTSRAFFR